VWRVGDAGRDAGGRARRAGGCHPFPLTDAGG
jgi:hypothetical protein